MDDKKIRLFVAYTRYFTIYNLGVRLFKTKRCLNRPRQRLIQMIMTRAYMSTIGHYILSTATRV